MDQYQLLIAVRTMDEIIEMKHARHANAALASRTPPSRNYAEGSRRRAIALSLLLAFAILLALLAVTIAPTAGSAAQVAIPTASTPSAASGDFASLVDIGGRALDLHCQGEGSPTVILEAGRLLSAA